MSAAHIEQAVAHIRAAYPLPWPRQVLVLGSGLAEVPANLEVVRAFDYRAIPGFPRPSVAGHAGSLAVGTLCGQPIAVLQGREHYYEQGSAGAMAVPLRALRALGAERLLMTNAVGSVQRTMPPGSLVLVSDHINLTGANPLIGDDFGPSRFVDMSNAYDAALRAELHAAAAICGLELHEGVYACFSGPSFETPAEIRAARILGADTVGMSVAPETVIARHCGLRVAAVSVVTNFAAGIAVQPLSHTETMRAAREAAPRCRSLIEAYLGRFSAVEAVP